MTMLDENLARIRTHRNNIHRCRRLLRTRLSDLERALIERRLADEQAAFNSLFAKTFPLTFSLPKDLADSRNMQGGQGWGQAQNSEQALAALE